MAGFWGVSRAIEPLDSNGLMRMICGIISARSQRAHVQGVMDFP